MKPIFKKVLNLTITIALMVVSYVLSYNYVAPQVEDKLNDTLLRSYTTSSELDQSSSRINKYSFWG